jgi:hypothetical protein
MNWSAYFAQLGIILLSVPSIGIFSYYIGKAIIDRWFKAREQDYQHRLQAQENEHKHRLDILKETHIESLRQLSKRDEIGFTKLHEIRAEHIANLYDKVLELYWVGTEFLPGNHPKSVKQEEFFNQVKVTWFAIEKTKIYFTKEQAKKFIAFVQEIRSMGIDRMVASENFSSEMPHAQLAATEDNIKRWKKLQDTIPKMLESIEDDLRLLLRVEATEDTKP